MKTLAIQVVAKGYSICYKGISRLSYLMCERHTKKYGMATFIYRNSADYGTWKAVRNWRMDCKRVKNNVS